MTDVLLPQWGMGMQEGTVLRWLKSVGDTVEEGEALAEVEAEKVDTMLESPAAGVLAEILVEADETVTVGTVLCRIDGGGVGG